MDSSEHISPIPAPYPATVTVETELRHSPQQKKEGLSAIVRQTINAAAKRVQPTPSRKVSTPDLSNLTEKSQELILRAVETIRDEDSRQMVDVLDESRDMLRNSFEEFKREQEEYRQQLKAVTKHKQAAIERQRENLIPISIFLRQKKDVDRLADLRPNSSLNPTYQAYFEALLTPSPTEQQHPTDRAAVVKYIRRRERRRRAEANRKTFEVSEDILEKQTAVLMEKIEGVDIKLEHERRRQSDLLQARVSVKKAKAQNVIEANGIIDQAAEAELVRQRLEQAHREKIEARLSAVRRQQNRTPTTMIRVQSRGNAESDPSWNNEDVESSHKSIQLLNGSSTDRSTTTTTTKTSSTTLNSVDTLAQVHI